ncbi:hypothetical protein [Peribacillus frigoritolerans]|uniref:hypothetical protein n=1 Tax=Peribacillus frigoritolerans TaxID=450367 RepID=UPI0024C1EF41|nr:hypothetical protein [Peribacillus frigoritolerans]WHX62347.1 hypothetical protein QNH33_01675 [Peribacillus frigoritolerans]
MSIKSRLNRIEKRLPDESKAAEKVTVDIEGLLFMDYEEFRKVYIEWAMACYMEQHEKADELNAKAEHFIKTLEPITKSSQFDYEAYQELLVRKIVDWMEEHGVELEDDRWERVFGGD